jgi:hypothetical protein
MIRKLTAAALLAVTLTACSDGGFQRGVFYGKVIDQSPEEVISAFGKPESIDSSVPDTPKYIYSRKTFNPDNLNTVDDKTIVEFAKDKSGKIVCTDVSYL